MNNALLKLYVNLKTLMMVEEGQDLAEYALILGLVSVGAIAGLSTAGTAVTKIVSQISSTLTAAA